MPKRNPFATCPSCGSALDHGERCDCEQTQSATHGSSFYCSKETAEEKARRRAFVFALMEGGKKRRRGA